jgi:nucleoside-diphosphate-sugar epimerase
MIFILGGNGRLGQALAAAYGSSRVTLLERSLYAQWTAESAADAVSRHFEGSAAQGGVIFAACGLLDPALAPEDLMRVNFTLPRNLIAGAARLGFQVVSFGTMTEVVLRYSNPYIDSKRMLSDYVGSHAAANCRCLQLRIHTLYGAGRPSPFMFLGQMLNAILEERPFEMTEGRQLREYHHMDDEVTAIRRIVEVSPPGVLDINHGQPVSLRSIAERVFRRLGKDALLRLGAKPEPAGENHGEAFERPAVLRDLPFRESLPAIEDFMQEQAQRLAAVH